MYKDIGIRAGGGVKTGFRDIDAAIGGFENGQLILLGGRPFMGKSSLAYSLIDNICIKQKKPTIYISLDLSEGEVKKRVAQVHGDLTSEEVKDNMREGDLFEAYKEVADAPLRIFVPYWLRRQSYVCAYDIARECHRIMEREPISLIVIDYLQLFTLQSEWKQRKDTQKVLKELRDLARETDCPVLLLSQLSRKTDRRRNKRPKKTDFRNVRRPHKAADMLLLLYREDYYELHPKRKGIAEIHAINCRNGKEAVVELGFMASKGKFYDKEMN